MTLPAVPPSVNLTPRISELGSAQVKVDRHRLHAYCTGEGSPTVILEAGWNDCWLNWYLVQPEVAKFTRVCSYDRAGMGWSDAGPYPRTSHVIALDQPAAVVEAIHQVVTTARQRRGS